MREWIGRLGPLAACAALASSAAAQTPTGAPPATATPSAPTAAPTSPPPAATAPAATPPPGTPPPAKATPPAKGGPGKKVEPPLPPVEARVWLIAPSPQEPWVLRIDNEGAIPLRIPADARLLRFEIQRPDEKNPKRTKTIKCRAPEGLRPDGFPEARALLLAPGQSYVEAFSPFLHCFGKDAAAIAGASVVRSTFGWDAGPKGTRKPPEPPFAAQGTDHPPSHEPARGLGAPTVVLSFHPSPPSIEPEEPAAPPAPPAPAAPPAPSPTDHPTADKPDTSTPAAKEPTEPAPAEPRPTEAAPEPAPIVDETAPRLAITAAPFADASAPSRVSISVKVENAGHRPMTVALRARMLSFRVEGAGRKVECSASPATHALPREAYQKLKPGGSTSFSVLLAEVCPRETFARQGLYRVTPTLHAEETGNEAGVNAFTAVVRAPAPTLVRVQSAPEPYHREPPKAVPTSGL